MAVPKKRTGASAQAKRRANWKATKPEVTKCSNCGELVLAHTVCAACGFYKGKAVSLKAKAAEIVEEAKEPKKSAKKVKEEPKVEVDETANKKVASKKVEKEDTSNEEKAE